MNVKDEFIKWFFKNTDRKYGSISESQFKSDLEESQKYFNRNLYEVDSSNFKELIDFLDSELYENEEFLKYSFDTGKHRPRAILGKKNYIKFLTQKFTGDNKFKTYSIQEKEELKKFYDSLKNKTSFQNWLVVGSVVIRTLKYDNEKFSSIITAENQATLFINNLPILSYREIEGNPVWGYILKNDYIQSKGSTLSIHDTLDLKKSYNQDYVFTRFYMQSSANLTEEFENEFFKAIEKNYDYFPNSGFSGINKNNEGVNNALLYVLLQDENIDYFFDDISNIELGTHKVYKLSMGIFYKTKKFRENNLIDEFLNQSIGVMHEKTGHGQAERFKKEVEIGDYIYITFGKDRLDGLYQIKSGYQELGDYLKKIIKEEGYIFRNLTKIKAPFINHTRDLKNDTRPWMPSGNTTFVEIIDIEEANRVLFKPYYDVEFVEDNSKKTKQLKFIESNFPLNQILYGPPGTGKTYKTKSLAVQIVNPGFSPSGSNDIEKRKSIVLEYDRLFENEQIVFTTFHQSFGYEDFVEGIKPSTTEDKKVIYDVAPGVFKKLCEKAKNNWLEFKKGKVNGLSFDEAFAKLKEEWEENENISFPLKTQGKDYKIIGFTESSIQFEKASGGTGHTLSIATLRDAFYDRKEIRSTDVGIYYPGILDKLKSYQSELPNENTSSNRENLKNYVLVIDEINRGNVSGIFGELITLLEPDKRMGREEEISVELPYSKEQFTVPPNVFLIGTMNTADRSVEALDTALRRRFAFEEIIPKPELLKNITFEGFNLQEVLKTINERIEALVDRDHTIGHSYFINLSSGDTEGLQNIFENKVIPLLQEYFYNDYQKIALVLGKGFVEKIDRKANFAKFEGIDFPDLEASFELKPIEDIENSILHLLNKNEE